MGRGMGGVVELFAELGREIFAASVGSDVAKSLTLASSSQVMAKLITTNITGYFSTKISKHAVPLCARTMIQVMFRPGVLTSPLSGLRLHRAPASPSISASNPPASSS
jgi:hypothetical protein